MHRTLGIRTIICVAVLSGSFVVSNALGQSVAEEEHVLWQLWQRHQSDVTAHAQIIAMCNQIESRSPRHRLLPVVQSLAAWHLLKSGDTNTAARSLTQINRAGGSTPIARSAQRMARTWLTRLDREQVRQALQAVYRKNVQFPETLEPLQALPSEDRTPIQDRWGDPWIYEWETFRVLQVSPGQRYRLESRNIRTTSDLDQALKIPYGAGFGIRPVRLIGAGAARETIEFQRTTETDPPEQVLLTEGTSYRGVTLAYIGERILILTDGDHWSVFPKPAP